MKMSWHCLQELHGDLSAVAGRGSRPPEEQHQVLRAFWEAGSARQPAWLFRKSLKPARSAAAGRASRASNSSSLSLSCKGLRAGSAGAPRQGTLLAQRRALAAQAEQAGGGSSAGCGATGSTASPEAKLGLLPRRVPSRFALAAQRGRAQAGPAASAQQPEESAAGGRALLLAGSGCGLQRCLLPPASAGWEGQCERQEACQQLGRPCSRPSACGFLGAHGRRALRRQARLPASAAKRGPAPHASSKARSGASPHAAMVFLH